jgi:hypothetical protein
VSDETDFERMAEFMSQALKLPLPAEYRAGVVANLEIAYRLAPLFLEHPLEDEAEPAPIYGVGSLP